MLKVNIYLSFFIITKHLILGIDLAYDYLEKKNIPHKKVGKLIVATEEKEVPDLLVS